MKKNIVVLAKNAAWYSGNFIILNIINLIATPIILKKIGIESYGIYILLTSFIGYYNLLDLGLNQGLVKFVAEYLAKGDQDSINKSINSSFVFQSLIGLTASLLLIIFSTAFIYLLNIRASLYPLVKMYIYICSFGSFFTLLNGTLTATLQGLQRFDIISKIDSSMNIIMNIIIIFLLLINKGLLEIFIVTSSFSFLSFSIYFFIVKIKMPLWKFFLKFDTINFKKLIKYSSFIMFSKISNMFNQYLIRFVISFFLGPIAVSLFVIPVKLLNAFGGILSSASNVIFPYTSQKAVFNRERVKDIFVSSSKIFAAISIPVYLFIFFCSKEILTVWVGAKIAEESYLVLSILAFSNLIASQSAIPNLIVTGLGHSKTLGLLGIISIINFIIFLPILTKLFNTTGASMGLLLSSMLNLVFVFKLTTKKVGIQAFTFVNTVFKPHLILLIIYFILYAAAKHFLPYSIIIVFIEGTIFTLSYFLFIWRSNILKTEILQFFY